MDDVMIGMDGCIVPGLPTSYDNIGDDGQVTVNQETCFGCGYCKQACPTDAIKIRQTMPMRESLHEYFQKERALDLVVD